MFKILDQGFKHSAKLKVAALAEGKKIENHKNLKDHTKAENDKNTRESSATHLFPNKEGHQSKLTSRKEIDNLGYLSGKTNI